MADTETNETAGADVDAIKGDVEQLREDLASLLRNVGSFSKEKLADARDRVSAALGAFEGRAYGRAQGTARTVRERGYHAMDASRGAVEKKPITYIIGAFAVGMILASLFDWKKKS